MGNNKTKKVKFYVYTIKNNILSNSNEIETIFNKKLVNKNILSFGENDFCLIYDKIENNYLKFRFIKLKGEIPRKLNKFSGESKLIDIDLDKERISYQSHFILDLENNIIFSEYNHNAARHINTNLTNYLNKKYELKDNLIEIIPLKNLDTYNELKSETKLKLLKTKLKSNNLKNKELNYNIFGILGNIKDYGDDNGLEVEIILRKSKSSESLNKEEIEKFIEKHKDETTDEHKKFLETLKVETENTVYDLLNNNLTYYLSDEIDKNNGFLDSKQVFNELIRLYNLKKKIILSQFKD